MHEERAQKVRCLRCTARKSARMRCGAHLAVHHVEVLIREEAQHFVDVLLAVQLRHGHREAAALEVCERQHTLLCAVQRVQHAEYHRVSVVLLELGRLLHACRALALASLPMHGMHAHAALGLHGDACAVQSARCARGTCGHAPRSALRAAHGTCGHRARTGATRTWRNSRPGWCCSTCCMNCVRSPCVRYSAPGWRSTRKTQVSASAPTRPSARHQSINSSAASRSCPGTALRNTSYTRYLNACCVCMAPVPRTRTPGACSAGMAQRQGGGHR
jgi:hypothetical protein